jgi:hypothetical protein
MERIYPHTDIIAAHKHCYGNRAEILRSELCGCLCCLARFRATEIEEWVDESRPGQGQTALCPKCGIDSVIGTASGYSLSTTFLAQMKAYWFSRKKK